MTSQRCDNKTQTINFQKGLISADMRGKQLSSPYRNNNEGCSFINDGIGMIGDQPRDIEYKYSPIFKNFDQAKSGFGFSNFRVNDNVRVVQQPDGHLSPVIERDNPVAMYEYMRNNNFLFEVHHKDLPLIDKDKKSDAKNYLDLFKTINEVNPLMIAFISPKNIEYLKKLMKFFVYKMEGYTISADSQSEEQLVMIMRYCYMKATGLIYNATGQKLHEQICSLNRDVLYEAVPILIVSIKEYLAYAKDRSTNPYTIDRPVNVSNAGMKNPAVGFADNII